MQCVLKMNFGTFIEYRISIPFGQNTVNKDTQILPKFYLNIKIWYFSLCRFNKFNRRKTASGLNGGGIIIYNVVSV